LADEPEKSDAVDYASQILALRQVLQEWGGRVRCHNVGDFAATAREIGVSRRGEGPPSVVVGDSVGAEIGRPSAVSRTMVLTTRSSTLVEDGWVHCIGPDLDQATPERNLPFAQIVMLAHPSGKFLDPFELQSTGYLANRLEGYMVRTVPGRLWVRISREALDFGFTLGTLGAALLSAYRMDFPQVTAAEVVLATERLEDLDSISAEAKVLSGQHRKLVMVESGVYECEDLDCDTCDEQEVCDALRDVTVRYRKRSAS
jgi:CO dehydrogenase/acetyl-CoA synthase beta subunit